MTGISAAPVSVSDRKAAVRNSNVDAYRGFVMLLMMAEVLRLSRVSQGVPDNWFWSILAWNQTHVSWAGASLHDLIQPSFSFLVGVAVPYSIASRVAKGARFGDLFAHTLWRSFVLVALGILLRSMHTQGLNFTFEDTLTQIGLGYPFLFLLGWKPPRWQWIALGAILFGYWLAWALYPIAPGLPFEAHWAKNANFGHSFDVWFLNLFPRPKPFIANGGGYLTLSFIPTLGTMILGLAAGRWLRASAPDIPYRRFLLAGVIGLAAGAVLHYTGICPVVKRIWTPSWTLFSGGACFLLLAAFCRMRAWFPLVVIGMNSILAYVIAHVITWPQAWSGFSVIGPPYEPLLRGTILLTVYWLILWVMYRRRIFVKI